MLARREGKVGQTLLLELQSMRPEKRSVKRSPMTLRATPLATTAN
jgi:hypothetical protein